MKIPLHISGRYTPDQAQTVYDLYVTRMQARHGNGFRLPLGSGSRRIRTRKGWGKDRADGIEGFLNGLILIATHGRVA